MSANNQLVIVKKNDEYNVYMNRCVDNEFVPEKEESLNEIPFKGYSEALLFAQELMKQRDFIVEYGITFINEDIENRIIKCKKCGNDLLIRTTRDVVKVIKVDGFTDEWQYEFEECSYRCEKCASKVEIE